VFSQLLSINKFQNHVEFYLNYLQYCVIMLHHRTNQSVVISIINFHVKGIPQTQSALQNNRRPISRACSFCDVWTLFYRDGL